MTPQEKAIQLVDNFMDLSEEREYNTPKNMPKQMAKQCALIAVDEIINFMTPQTDGKSSYDYWEEVKQEIEKL